MIDPLFWLGLSLLLVSFSLFAVLLVTIPTLQEVARAARSAEKLFDTLGINNATGIVKQVDQGLVSAKQQVQQNSLGLVAGVKAAWKVWRTPKSIPSSRSSRLNTRLNNFSQQTSQENTQDK